MVGEDGEKWTIWDIFLRQIYWFVGFELAGKGRIKHGFQVVSVEQFGGWMILTGTKKI